MVPSHSPSGLRLKLDGAVTAFKDQPSKSYHGHLLLLLVTARWWELQRLGWPGCLHQLGEQPCKWLSLPWWLSRTLHTDLRRHASLLRARLWNTSPESRLKNTCTGSAVKEIYTLGPEWPPSQCLLVTWLVCLISGKANKSPAAKCLLRSWLHWENKPVRRVTVRGVALCLCTGRSSCCPFIPQLPNNTSMQPARPRANASFPDIRLPKHPGLTHLRALITLNFNCLHVNSPQWLSSLRTGTMTFISVWKKNVGYYIESQKPRVQSSGF